MVCSSVSGVIVLDEKLVYNLTGIYEKLSQNWLLIVSVRYTSHSECIQFQ